MSYTASRAAIPVRVGFLPLVDCAPLVMAAVLGLDRRHGVELRLTREASWAGLRDKLLGGALDMAQALYGMVYGIELGIGGPRDRLAVLMTLNRNGQGISVSRRLADAGVRDLAGLAALATQRPGELVFAQTFPTGTHAMWLYYALASAGLDPLRDVRTVVLPPPQMVVAMRDAKADGASVGAPWNRLGAFEQVCEPLIASAGIWPEHPEKVLTCRQGWADDHADVTIGVIRAVLEAGRWLDASEANRYAAAEILTGDGWVATRRDAILDSLLGVGDPLPVRFHGDGEVNFPWLSDGAWFLTQHKRWGLLAEHPDYDAVTRRVQRVDLYREAAAGLRVPLPSGLHRRSVFFDGTVWDGSDPAAYADAFRASRPQALQVP